MVEYGVADALDVGVDQRSPLPCAEAVNGRIRAPLLAGDNAIVGAWQRRLQYRKSDPAQLPLPAQQQKTEGEVISPQRHGEVWRALIRLCASYPLPLEANKVFVVKMHTLRALGA